MKEKVNLELVFSRTDIIGCYNKKRLFEYYDILKNWLIKNNRKNAYQKIEISSLSKIQKETLGKYRDNFFKDWWDENLRDDLEFNIEGEYFFEYQTSYEIKFFQHVDEYFEHKKEGYEVDYYFDFLSDLRRDKVTNDKMFGNDGKEFNRIREINFPDYPDHILKDIKQKNISHGIKLSKWIKSLGYGQKEQEWALSYHSKPPHLVKEYEDYSEINKIQITNKDLDIYEAFKKNYVEEQKLEHEKTLKEIKESWG